jgi:hypothetical protein
MEIQGLISDFFLQVGLLNLQVRDLQQQISVLQAEKTSLQKVNDTAKTEFAKLKARFQEDITKVLENL